MVHVDYFLPGCPPPAARIKAYRSGARRQNAEAGRRSEFQQTLGRRRTRIPARIRLRIAMIVMSKRIVIDPVTRIEGHAKISIFMDDAGNVSDAEFHVVEFRGFEKFCEGRPYTRDARHHPAHLRHLPREPLCSPRPRPATRIMAVNIPPAADKLRRLMNLGQIDSKPRVEFLPFERAGFSARLGHAAGAAQCFRPDRLEQGSGPRRHPPAPVRPGNHRDSRRQKNSSRLGRARRRAQRVDRGRPRENPRLAARSLRHHEGRVRPVQENDGNPPARNPDFRKFSVAVHGPRRAGRHLGTSRRQVAFHRQQRQHHRRPA